MIIQWHEDLSDIFDGIQIWFDSFLPFLLMILLLIIIWILGRFLKILVNYLPRIPPDGKNAIKMIISITQILVFTTGSFSLLGISQEFLLGISAIVATVIGFASTSVASNVYAGLYLIATRPFTVGDLIRTQNTVGIVEEISLSYTRIVKLDKTTVMIPNSSLLSASLLNYSIENPSFDEEEDNKTKVMIPFRVLPLEFYNEKRYIRYRALLQLQVNVISPPISITELNNRLNKVCEEFKHIFGLKPTFYLGKHDFRQNIFFLITAPDGYTIFNTWPYFLESIVENVYVELQEGIEE
jgi:small-conductance mechanosensitive channel